MDCIKCCTAINRGDQACAQCGTAVPNLKKLIVIPLVVIAVLIFMFSARGKSDVEKVQDTFKEQRMSEKKAIETCWEEYERKSLSTGEKRSIASVCEMQEAAFLKKHGFKP